MEKHDPNTAPTPWYMQATELKCPDCDDTQFVVDHHEGSTICIHCGVVVESHMFEEASVYNAYNSYTDIQYSRSASVLGRRRRIPDPPEERASHKRPSGGYDAAHVIIRQASQRMMLLEAASASACDVYDQLCSMYKPPKGEEGRKTYGVVALYATCKTCGYPRLLSMFAATINVAVDKVEKLISAILTNIPTDQDRSYPWIAALTTQVELKQVICGIIESIGLEVDHKVLNRIKTTSIEMAESSQKASFPTTHDLDKLSASIAILAVRKVLETDKHDGRLYHLLNVSKITVQSISKGLGSDGKKKSDPK